MRMIYGDTGRDTLIVNNEIMLNEEESISYLDNTSKKIDEYIVKVNKKYDMRVQSRLKKSYSLSIIGLGDVGGNVLLGLKLLGGKTLSKIGIYDRNSDRCKRYELEMNQIFNENFMTEIPVESIEHDAIFESDVVVFTASVTVPEVGKEQGDVRKIQFADNQKIIHQYIQQAVEAGFEGLFLVVSDPVDLLCKSAFDAAKEGLLPSQIIGFGQGVMYARARYYAKEMGIEEFEKEGRIFGPHGSELIVANSLKNYDDEISRALTKETIEANLKVRACGFKPYIAPAFSSGALSILSYLRGQWVYSSQYLGGYFYGLYGKMTEDGLMIETSEIPEQLMKRIESSYREMKEYYDQNQINC
jgi:hypothetical protein